jgi:CheY-like chemotaxis protein/HPt (histidine-containing phosphotransfer) domain-containing protein
MVVAVIRHLVDGLNDSLRIQAEALRTQVRTFEQNAAVEASLVKERFAATISHELRTPLGGIIGMAELLDRTSLTERQRSWTTAIRHSADTLLRIVNDVLDFSRVESGQLEFEEIPYSLGQLVDDVALLFREQARKNGVALLAFVDPTLPETALGDPVRIKQVLQNLVNNAVRFTHAGSIRIEVAPECVLPDAPMIRFSVHDTGIGIAPSAQERIFSPFVQADASTARRFGGTGLGLAIARHLVELMGGRISVGSRVGIGSTFTFTIPLRTALAADENQVPLRDLRILVVEPDDTVRELLRRYVDGWEMRSETVTSLAEAHANVVERGCENGRYAVVLVGSGIAPAEASRFVDDVRAIRALRDTSFLYLCSDRADDHPCPPGFDDCVPGALRQSKLFDVICRLTHRDLASRIVPPPDTAQRRPRSERILIAEDNEVNQALLAAQLEHLGFTADVVGNGAAAVEAVATHSYDLIFMDVQMPGMDGFEAARRIRASAKQTTPLPIIAVTANVLPGYRDVCLAAGMNDYLTKPALIAPLTAMVDHWLPALRTPAAPAPPPPAAPDFRQRLRSIFHGDDARVEATVALALTSLNDCMTTLRAALVEHDAPAAARVTHKLKGVAMEIGFVGIVDLARELERAIGANDWAAIDVAHVALGRAIDEELPPAENGPT